MRRSFSCGEWKCLFWQMSFLRQMLTRKWTWRSFVNISAEISPTGFKSCCALVAEGLSNWIFSLVSLRDISGWDWCGEAYVILILRKWLPWFCGQRVQSHDLQCTYWPWTEVCNYCGFRNLCWWFSPLASLWITSFTLSCHFICAILLIYLYMCHSFKVFVHFCTK